MQSLLWYLAIRARTTHTLWHLYGHFMERITPAISARDSLLKVCSSDTSESLSINGYDLGSQLLYAVAAWVKLICSAARSDRLCRRPHLPRAATTVRIL